MIDETLRDEVRRLGNLLGETINDLAPEDSLELIERVRELSKSRRAGEEDAEKRLIELIESLSAEQTKNVIRGFSIFFDLANLAEDRQRARILKERETEIDPAPRAESIGAAIGEFKRMGASVDLIQSILDRLNIEPVFTAHPTEAKRRSIREKVRDFREHLGELDDPRITPAQRRKLNQELMADLAMLWQTDLLRDRRPTVLEELDRSLFFFSTLWDVAPELYRELRIALATEFPDQNFRIPTFLRFGTWIGGDRDGNPNVTWDVTKAAILRLRQEVLIRHIKQCRKLRRSLSLSKNHVVIDSSFEQRLAESIRRWPEFADLLKPIAPDESYRRFLRLVQWRLEQTLNSQSLESLNPGAYSDSAQLQDDVQQIFDSLKKGKSSDLILDRFQSWIDQIAVFGFHAMRMDVRQESGWNAEAIHEIFSAAGIADNYLELNEPDRQKRLTETLGQPIAIAEDKLGPQTQETLNLFRLLANTVKTSGNQSLGCYIISMTKQPSDVLVVQWLSTWAAKEADLSEASLPMPIVPLYETIQDLKSGSATTGSFIENEQYRQHLERTGKVQVVMIGYSDSTKDGGYLAASWAQYQGQLAIQAQAERQGIRVLFFHGRGGALGRGGGPAARSILSSPARMIDGGMRVTEQGEVLSARYDDPQIAKRHLEQMIWATMLVTGREEPNLDPQWFPWLEELAETALKVYRDLVESQGFLTYFDLATPISEIEQLPIGSRPPRRAGERSLDKLRAIPWVFSWTQNRHILPAWYGLGTALSEFRQQHPQGTEELRKMYQQWPYFHGLIENAALALAKADMEIGRHYASLCHDTAVRESIWNQIETDYRLSCEAVLAITQRDHLLDEIPWLKTSIAIRNPYIDPLNFMQIELLKKKRAQEEMGQTDPTDAAVPPTATASGLIRLCVQGIAAGLRTTG